jgi:biopolymer transport protein ExbB/TolQ
VTTEERFAKMEHILAGHIGQAKKDYEENRRLWRELRDNQEQSRKDWDHAFAESRRLADEQWERIRTENAARDKAADKRIEDLVKAIGAFISKADQVLTEAKK